MDQDNKKTAVEWLEEKVRNFNGRKQTHYEYNQMFIQAKQMEADVAQQYAKFCVLSDRQGMRLLEFNDFVKTIK